MAVQKCKGALLKLTISSTLTTIAQLLEVTPPREKSLDFDHVTLDQADVGTHRDLTGYTEADPVKASIFWDPSLAPHVAIRAAITTPAKTVWQIALADTGTTTIDFTAAGISIGPQVDAKNGLKAELELNVDGVVAVTT